MAKFDQPPAGDYPVFLGSEFKHPKPVNAFFHILPIPYATAGSEYSGCEAAPKSILEASGKLEAWDGKSQPAQSGIHTHAPVDGGGGPEQVMGKISAAVKQMGMGKFPIGLGGDHTISYGMVKGLLEAGYEDFGVIQIDAHANLRESDNGSLYTPKTVMKRIVDEDIPIFQLGVRVLCREEMEARKVYGVKYYDAEFLVTRAVSKFELPVEFPDRVFFSVGVSGLDASIFPSASTPVPGGLGWYQTLSLFESVVDQSEVLGFDVSGLVPDRGLEAQPFSASLLAYKMMGIIERARK